MPKTKPKKQRGAVAALEAKLDRGHVITLRLPTEVVSVLNEACKLSGLTFSQLANAMLALRLVTLEKQQPLTAPKPARKP